MKSSKVPDGFWSAVRKSSGLPFTKDQIRELIQQLEAVAGHAIADPIQFKSELDDCAVHYFAHKAYHDKSPRAGSIALIYKDLSASTAKTREIVEGLLKNDYVAYPMLEAISEKVSPKDPSVRLGYRGPLMETREQLSKLEEWTHHARKIVASKAKTDKGGRRREISLPILVDKLADLYEKTTGKNATITSNAYKDHDQRGGKFVDFIKSVLAILEPEKKRRALGQTVRDHLAERKKIRSG